MPSRLLAEENAFCNREKEHAGSNNSLARCRIMLRLSLVLVVLTLAGLPAAAQQGRNDLGLGIHPQGDIQAVFRVRSPLFARGPFSVDKQVQTAEYNHRFFDVLAIHRERGDWENVSPNLYHLLLIFANQLKVNSKDHVLH